jgi:hypothetical protein
VSDIETRVRRAMRTEAERARPEQLRPIVVNSTQRRTPRRRWLAPAAAALVVATTIAGVAVAVHASGLFAGTSRSRPISSTFTKPPWPVRDNRMPAYYVNIYYGKAINRTTITMTAAVYSSATGALLRTVALPNLNGPSDSGPVITAAGDDRHFVIALPTAPSGVTRFYLLTLGANGRTASIATLPIRPIPANTAVSGIALTPDGTRLAITIEFPYYRTQYYREGKPTSEVKVVNLVTGSVRTWTTRQHIPLGDGGASEPSWGDGGRLLGFLWNEHDGVPDRGLYVLDTATPDSNLMAARRLFRGIGDGLDAYLTNSGQTVIADMDASDHTPGAPMNDGYPSIVEYSAQTGQVIRTLWGPPRKATPAGCSVVSIDPSGKYLLVITRHFGRLVNGKFTRLPLRAGTEPIAAW